MRATVAGASDHREGKLPWLVAIDEEELSSAAGRRGPRAAAAVVACLLVLTAAGAMWRVDRSGPASPPYAAHLPPNADDHRKQTQITPLAAKAPASEAKSVIASAPEEKPARPNAQDRSAHVPLPVTNRLSSPAPTPVETAELVPAARTPLKYQGQIQLGAFSSKAAAERSWSSVSDRVSGLGQLSRSIVETNVGGRRLYRLRAAGADAKYLCARIRAARQSCVVVQD
jgi:hypothetical protein